MNRHDSCRRGLVRRAWALTVGLVIGVAAHASPPTTGTPAAPQRAQAPQAPATRGALLYQNHCIECHNTQMHWRDRRAATDWPSLVAQVARWQREARQNWSAADIDEVARHLNDRYYRFAVPRTTGGLPSVYPTTGGLPSVRAAAAAPAAR